MRIHSDGMPETECIWYQVEKKVNQEIIRGSGRGYFPRELRLNIRTRNRLFKFVDLEECFQVQGGLKLGNKKRLVDLPMKCGREVRVIWLART